MNVISCNTVLMNNLLLNNNYTTTQSHNILTFKQIVGKESPHIVLSELKEYYKEKQKFKETIFFKQY